LILFSDYRHRLADFQISQLNPTLAPSTKKTVTPCESVNDFDTPASVRTQIASTDEPNQNLEARSRARYRLSALGN